MTGTQLRFAIFGNEYQKDKSSAVTEVLSQLRKYGAHVLIDAPYYEFLHTLYGDDIVADELIEDNSFDAHYAISMGGDGTLLTVASRVANKQIPIVGINMGRLGFLSCVLPSEINTVFNQLFSGKCLVEEHTALVLDIDNGKLEGSPFALNDIAVLKRDHASMISITAKVNGEILTTYQSDGLIVSTPTGSTAYNLSNGGPIIAPNTHNLCITPVAPHSLSIRPIVLSDDSVVELSVESRSHSFLVAVDGRSERLKEGTRITIRKAPFAIQVVKKSDNSYFRTIREKLMWGVDQRH